MCDSSRQRRLPSLASRVFPSVSTLDDWPHEFRASEAAKHGMRHLSREDCANVSPSLVLGKSISFSSAEGSPLLRRMCLTASHLWTEGSTRSPRCKPADHHDDAHYRHSQGCSTDVCPKRCLSVRRVRAYERRSYVQDNRWSYACQKVPRQATHSRCPLDFRSSPSVSSLGR